MLNRLKEKQNNEEGFTLIELLIVIIVLGILAAIVVFAVGTTRDDSVAASCRTNFKAVELSAEAVNTKTGDYPVVTAAVPTGTDTQSEVNTKYADLILTGPADVQNGALLSDNYPFSKDYRLMYVGTADNFSIEVQDGATGVAVATTPTEVAGCDFL